MKTAAGAFAYLPVCQIGNIRQTLEKLKERGFGQSALIWTAVICIRRI